MKLTKTKLKQIIKEELDNVLGETWEPDPVPDLDQLVTKVSACVASGGRQVKFTCMPIALELANAVSNNPPDVFGALRAARRLNNCVPATCKEAVADAISALSKIGVAEYL